MNNNPNHNNDKLLKVLIVIGIIAILISVYIQYSKPFIAELQKQKRDLARIQDLSSIDSVLNKLRETNPNLSLGEPNKVYISLPSFNADCQGLELFSLPDSWEYRCKPESEFQKIDGQGWIPVDFTQLPKDFDFKSTLAIDPVNTADSGYYYVYVVGEKNDWVLTSLLESDKSLKETASKDNGTDPARFEVGSNLQLWAKTSGLIGYWKFDEEERTTAADSSGNNNTGLINGPNWADGKIGGALSFDGVNDYVYCEKNETLDITGNITIEAWVKPNINHSFPIISKDTYHQDYEFGYRVDVTALELNYRTPNLYTPESKNFILNTKSWSHFVVSANCDDKIVNFYINGVMQGNQPITECLNNYYHKPLFIGSRNGSSLFFNGAFDEVRIHNRALNTAEIQVIYNATK